MSEDISGINLKKEVIITRHSKLERSDRSAYRSICPVCQQGTLLVERDPRTFQLKAEDICILCGQHFIYEDILDPVIIKANIKPGIQWILIKDKLPENCVNGWSTRVIIKGYNEHGDLDVTGGFYDYNLKVWTCDVPMQDVISWAENNDEK